ncbi:hypothetical protein AB0907_14710 [Streptomyces sp. NPDC006975]|uniref:hypothetical protein n=1 Tax=Streptomyces sp. NPDC006975 TaxID=3154310 RepID=UPI0034517673
MTTYQVCWTSEDVCAEDPLSAAKEAWDMLRDPEAFPPVFEVRTDGETTLEVDLLDDTIRPTSSNPAGGPGTDLFIAAYLATYPHPLPGLDASTARIVRADQLRQGDVILGAFQLDDQQPGRATLQAHIPRYADPPRRAGRAVRTAPCSPSPRNTPDAPRCTSPPSAARSPAQKTPTKSLFISPTSPTRRI